MTPPDLPQANANPITEDDIAHYLLNSPDFFARHAEVLAGVQFVSPHSKRTVSLQERQAEMLREKIKVLEARIVEVPLVSAKMGYGGTPDWYGLVDGIPTLLDIKTSAQVYAEHWIQLAAYRLLLQEAGHEVAQVGVLHLPRNLDGKGKAIMKGADKQEHHEQAWRLCQQVYAIKQIIG